MSFDWNPQTYLKFMGERLRPALDLMAQVPCEQPKTIFDLGCGPGNVTELLAKRWPQASVCGVDSSVPMLDKARAHHPHIQWVQADLNHWQVIDKADLLFSNAALHWLRDHDRLFPALLAQVQSGGALAVQMPNNWKNPTHMALFETVDEGPWRDRLSGLVQREPISRSDDYYAWLAPQAERVEIWETTYTHVLEGEDPVVNWTKGSVLRPFLEALQGEEQAEFYESYRRKIAKAYPVQNDGKTLLAFKRLFILAIKG